MPQEVQEKSARAMEVYTAMVDRMNWNIGRVLEHIKSTGEYDNTFIPFMSDNGAEGASYEALPSPSSATRLWPTFTKYYNNNLDNIGRGDSFVWYGSQWVQAATAPSPLLNWSSTEGGCRAPLVIRPPPRKADAASAVTNAYCTVMGVVPTVLENAALKHPGTHYKGREIARLCGKSWVPLLDAVSSRAPSSGDEYFLIHGEEYITGGPQKWELFNIKENPGETRDRRDAEPGKFDEMIKLWEEYEKNVGVGGVAGDYPEANLGRKVPIRDEFDDPNGWIKFIVEKQGAQLEMDSAADSQRPLFACIICRARKVKCDKAPSGCTRCRSVGVQCPGYRAQSVDKASEEIDNIYRRAGLERRRAGACQECRAAKAKCSQTKPRCRRCEARDMPCTYPSSMNAHRHTRSPSARARDIPEAAHLSGIGVGIMAPDSAGELSDSSWRWLYQSMLPDKSGLKLLAESYFSHVHSLRNLGFIHKPTFIRSIDQGTTAAEFGEAVLYLVCALGARYMLSSRVSQGTASSDIPGRIWGRKARKLVRTITCISSVQNLMAMVLYAEYGLRIGDNAFVYMIVGCCTRMSRFLRMDEEDSRPDSPEIHGEALTRRESKRRLMWSCYILDSFVGAGVDGNLSWVTDIPNIPLACSERNFLHRTNNPPVYAEVDRRLHSLTPTGLRGNICRVVYIRTQILRHLRDHDAGNPARPPPWDESSTFMTLLNQVEAWCKELPDFLTFNDINIYIHKEQNTPGSYFFLHLMYHACVFDLTRVTLPGYNFPLAAALADAPADFIVKNRQKAWHHACCVSTLLSSALECGSGALDDHYTSTAAFESTKIHVIYLTTVANGDSSSYSHCIDHINTNLRVLTETHPYSDMPNVYLSALLPLLQIFGFSDVASQWEPHQNTILHPPSSHTTDALTSSEVVGPVETAYLNQIATFRLARREVAADEDGKAKSRTPWTLYPSAPPSPHHSERSRLPDRSMEPGSQFMASLEQFVSSEPAVVGGGGAGGAQGLAEAVSPQMDQKQYLSMAEEIGQYMTWDVALPSQFDFPMEEYFSTPPAFEADEP
ncbi:hypothetical protein jhhlp_000628 [Lomentospora prolificans]|uniref:Zn(2)-C6 fungal-type domain-containing protein n=1 Tax=Lomentospora prolificans TaxID=41688 RepID=A0A2N3NJ98_9PEZI|nr:hypothetical protein jhhlp_000628 [Lomentospora prolificans]